MSKSAIAIASIGLFRAAIQAWDRYRERRHQRRLLRVEKAALRAAQKGVCGGEG